MERICTENPVCKLLPRGVTDTDKNSRCCLSLVPREKTTLPRSSESFLQLFLEEMDASSRFLVSQRIPLQSACAKFHQLFVRKKVGGFCSTHCHSKKQVLSHKKPQLKEF